MAHPRRWVAPAAVVICGTNSVASFARLCRDLFVLAHAGVRGRGAERGARWERRIADYVAASGLPVDVLPGGYTVFGHVALSGFAHQIDTSLGCSDALVICEWKA